MKGLPRLTGGRATWP